jgi:hypothetical protein
MSSGWLRERPEPGRPRGAGGVVLMEFALDARTKQLRAALVDFMHTWVYPAEPVFAAQLAQSPDQCAWDCVPVLAELRAQGRPGQRTPTTG